MKKLFTILFLLSCVTTYSQTFYYPVVVKQTLRVDGKVAFGGVTFDRDFTVTADTIRIKSLDGTGSILGIDVNGDVTRTTIGGGAITGLNQYEVLFGAADGSIDQDTHLQWSDAFNSDILYISGTNPLIDIRDPANNYVANYTNQQVFLSDGTGAALIAEYNMLRFVDDDNGSVSIFKKDDNSGTAYDIYFPPINGTSGQSLRLNGSLELEWFTPPTGTVTSIATTSPIGGGTITSTGTLNLLASGADKMLISSGVNTWAEIDVSPLTVSLFDNTLVSEYLTDLSIPTTANLIAFGDGSTLINNSEFSFNPGTEVFEVHRFAVDGSVGNISMYENNPATDGKLFVGESSSGLWKTGTITSSDITVGYSSPDITLSISGLDASKIGGGGVSTTEFDYLGGVTSDVQTQLDARSKVVATSHLTGQNAAIGATTLYAVPADGFYTITVQLAVTTTGGTSIGTQIRFTNVADNVVKTMPSNNSNGLNQCASSTTANAVCYTITAYCKSGTNIQYITNLAGSGQVYSLDAQVVKD